MKKITRFLRFLMLVFILFLAVTGCFIFNKFLDQKINESHSNALESLQDYHAPVDDNTGK